MSSVSHLEKFLSEKICLKNLSFPRIMSAPIDGVIDSPMRQMIRKFSKDELLFSEMFHVSVVAYEKTGRALKYEKIEQPLAFQISASSTRFVEVAVEKILEHNFVMLNLNSGCPAKNVIKSGSGSALMSKPDVLKEILQLLHKKLDGKIPLTLKIRAGFKEKNGLEIAKLAQDCGVEMLIIHPRTQPGGFSSLLDYDMVKKIKEELSIPIVFSGNIATATTLKKTYERTGVDGFMIGRALWGCPWRMKQIHDEIQRYHLPRGKEFSLSLKEILSLAIEHLDLNVKFYGEHGAQSFKKQLPQYIKGLPHAATLRQEFLRSKDSHEMRSRLKELLSSL